MDFKPDHFYHVYNRGNNKKPIFFEELNYIFFMEKMRTHIKPQAKLLAYCLMPNHFHWLLGITDNSVGNDNSLNLEIGTLLSSYTKAINKRYNRSGSLFQQKTKSVEIDAHEYLLTCFHYIHRNPIEAGLVKKPGRWLYSSYLDYAGFRNGTLIDKTFTLKTLGINRESIINSTKRECKKEQVEKIL